MSEILLLSNPRKRGAKKRRKMSAKQAKYFGGGRKRRVKRRASAKRRHAVVAAAPRRHRRRRHAAVSVRRLRRKSNPSFRGMSASVMPTLKAGAIGATGALGLDLLWGYGSQYLPASVASSPLAQYAVKLAGALAVGVIGNKVLRGRGRDMAVGAATVVLHDALKAQIKASFPTVQLGEYLTYAPTVGGTMRRAGRVLSTGMGEYLSGLPDQNGVTMAFDEDGANGTYSADNLSGTW